LLDAEKIMFDYGLTTVNDAGLDSGYWFNRQFTKAKAMKLNVYAMITVNQKTWICILRKGFTKLITWMFVLLRCMGMVL
jgi:hypothetical protein